MKAMLTAILAAHLSGHAHAAEPSEILLGQSAPLSGSFRELGEAYQGGAAMFFDQVNRHGGVHGQKIRLLTLDDGYTPKRAEANTRELIERNKVLALFGHMFTSTVRASLPVAAAEGVPYVAPYTGYDELYSRPANRVLFMTRASFGAEMDTLMKHIQTMRLAQVALVHYDSAPGMALLQEVKDKLAAIDRKLVVAATVKLNSADTAAAAEAIARSRPAAILLGISGSDAVAFVREYGRKSTMPAQFLARSLVGGHQLVAELGEQSRGIVMTQLAPSPFNGKTRVSREYQAALKAAKLTRKTVTPGYVSFEGYLAAKVMVEGLRRAGPNPSRLALQNALETMRDWDAGDFIINYNAIDHGGSGFVTTTVIGAGGHFIE